jgi:hypothetical protein
MKVREDYARGAAIGAAIAAILLGATASATSIAPALASPASSNWVEDESAMICNQMYLEYEVPGNWANLTVMELQTKHGISRAAAVAGIRQAVQTYCPGYVSAVPAR